MYQNIIEKLSNKYIAILGFGMEGKSTYNFIRKYLPDLKMAILDKNIIEYTPFDKDNNLEFVFGNHYLDNLEKYDLIIKAPGVSLVNRDITNIKDKITSQLELFLEEYAQQTIGVTGTKGKSTTTTLIYEILKKQGNDVYLLGNIGKAIFDDIEKFTSDSIIVIEMSALQLEFVKVSPHIGVIVNLYQDHLDHAGSVKHYHENKLNIFKYQKSNDIGIYPMDNEYLKIYMKNNNYKAKMYTVSLDGDSDIYIKNNYVYFNDKVLYDVNSKRTLIGDYNLENIMFVLFISELFNLDLDLSIKTINNFKTLPHRMEKVGTYNNITYYDDAISTIPEATINAVKALKKVDTLIIGGMDRGVDNTKLIKFLQDTDINNIICMPTTGHKIAKELTKKVYLVDTLEEAVDIAKEKTNPGSICLMSPGASSYEFYKNYIEKGNAYQKLIRE